MNSAHDAENVERLAEEQAKKRERPEKDDHKPSASQATRLVELCESVEFFHTPDNEPYATAPVADHLETWPVKGSDFKIWLGHQYFMKYNSAPCAQAYQDASGIFMAKALYQGTTQAVHLRVCEYDSAVYINMGNKEWQAIRIDRDGWSILDKAPVKFTRPRGMLALPRPVKSGGYQALRELRKYLSLEEGDFELILAWIVQAFCPSCPYLILVLYGQEGSAKSFSTRLIRAIVDPNDAPLRRKPRNADDLLVGAKSNHVLAFDNVSVLNEETSDDLCMLATGGALSKRAHYSNDEEHIIKARRPIVLNGISEFVVRGDLASRTITLTLPVINESNRRLESDIMAEFRTIFPSMLGVICDGISTALRNIDSTKLKRPPRMADAWQWITAAETAFGYNTGTLLKAFRKNQESAKLVVLNNSNIYPHLLTISKQPQEWQGTCDELLSKLNSLRSANDPYDPTWPRNAKMLSDRIRRLAPALKDTGIQVEFWKTDGHDSKRMLTIRKCSQNCDAFDASDAEVHEQCDEGVECVADSHQSSNSEVKQEGPFRNGLFLRPVPPRNIDPIDFSAVEGGIT